MQRSYLIQRLQQPIRSDHPLSKFGNPFAFGGGLANGGLSKTAMELTRELWDFDYMGAAEFEWGAVPEALSKLAQADKLVATSFTIKLADVAKPWRDKSKTKPKGEATIYVLCPEGMEDEIERRVRAYAADSRDDEFRLKEPTRLASTLRPYDDYDGETRGWLELDNGYMFFADEVMWQGTCALFGVEV